MDICEMHFHITVLKHEIKIFLPIFLFCFQFQFHAFTLCYRKKILKFTIILLLLLLLLLNNSPLSKIMLRREPTKKQ